jgi:hypothetical protein
MSQTDSPLKLLVRETIRDIAAWLLNADVLEVESLNIELTIESPRVDLLFRLWFNDGQHCLFHLEFQGRSSKPAMPRRQLNHLSRLALQEEWPFTLESFVLYTDEYAGANDTGYHQIKRRDGTPALMWQYSPVHLWREPAESILKLDRPGIIPLMGLMKIQHPQETFPEMIRQLHREPDETKREFLFTSLLTLMKNEEYSLMLEQLMNTDELLIDSPFLRRLQIRTTLKSSRSHIMQVILKRFNPPVQTYLHIEGDLNQIDNPETLEQLFAAALDAHSTESFMQTLQTIVSTPTPT